MDKKAYNYQLTIKGLTDLQGQTFENEPLILEFQNHDDLFKILEIAKSSAIFENPNDNTEFFIGLKLFSEVLLRNRKTPNPVLKDLTETVGAFMMKLKKGK
ncbi:protein of unknown function [Chitinophaga terrae (ex Kim and Jung 2007)]|uniref:DUF3861 domain-containing protein n=1 Tax=Chitinophaga terrae (ex Kim and Jung 2007) TaxID=408074 RepID=A0A1H4GF54_9BACT|nr:MULTISPECIES: DUF3861 family protein [Bacteroidota]GEP93331.1 hypothetical protein CTE07_49760 [Chitinophaga terrae (ex Kim and Jung 2007)]SEB07528.1 protein of unknown function [Chitinophaga terrae (ex Kim and Jung 2007)]